MRYYMSINEVDFGEVSREELELAREAFREERVSWTTAYPEPWKK
jgi:hypothetical protein